MTKQKFIFVIDDFYTHGGHVKSFISQLQTIENELQEIMIVCAESGYTQKNLHLFKALSDKNLRLVPLNKIRKWQFSWNLYSTIKSELSSDAILHIYSPECYFSALLAKSHFEDVVIINSVLGGPNPFPSLKSTDLYIAVSDEQKSYAVLHSNTKENNIHIIKNRIGLISIPKDIQTEKKSVLIVSRLDSGLKPSLNKIFSVLERLPNTCKILIAGTGDLEEELRNKYKTFDHIEFLGYCNNLPKYYNQTGVVLGMGRSILEFMLQGIPGILIGYNGIEALNNLENVKFASSYNFAGRKILQNIDTFECSKLILEYIDGSRTLDTEITTFLQNEYQIDYFQEKYLQALNLTNSSSISISAVFNEYVFIFFQRVKRKIKSLL